MAARVGLARLIQDNLRLLRQRQRLADDEPFVTLQVRQRRRGADSTLATPAPGRRSSRAWRAHAA